MSDEASDCSLTLPFLHPLLELLGGLDGDKSPHPVVAKTAQLRAGNLVLELGIARPRPHLRGRDVGDEPEGIVRPGMASCFTRNSGTPKLWIMSLLRSLTMIGLFTGR